MKNNTSIRKIDSYKHRALSPVLAVVILLGITVVAGGIVYSLFSTSATTASITDVIAIENAQAVKGTSHSDVTATVKNAGSQPWTSVEMTVSKSELSEPILYESLHENVVGCGDGNSDGSITTTDFDTTDAVCLGEGDGSEGLPDGNRDNPLRAQWLIALDKASGTDDHADKGEGAAVGRKLVFQSTDDLRTIQVLNGTNVAVLFGGEDNKGNTFSSGYAGNLETADTCSPSVGSWTNCTNAFQALDASTDGLIMCTGSSDDDIAAQCKVFTHTNIKDNPVAAGQSIYFYADAFTKEIPGLNNQVVRVGDNLVVNLFTENADGGTARVQTIIKVTGI